MCALYFGHATALQIARFFNPADCAVTRGAQNRPPTAAPHQKDVLDALRHLKLAQASFDIALPAHVLVAGDTHSRPTGLRVLHSCCTSLSSGAFRGIPLPCVDAGESHSVYFATPPFAFAQVAGQKQGFGRLLELGFELCGTYQTERSAMLSRAQVPPLTCARAIRDFAERNSSVKGAAQVKRILPYLVDGSASPFETKLALLLGLPKRHGGYGLGMPRMNVRVDLSASASAIAGRRYVLCDLAWPQARLDIEYQSEAVHANAESLISDSRRANALADMGWTVITVTKGEINTLTDMDVIANTVRRHLGRRTRPVTAEFRQQQARLRGQLQLRQYG